MAAGSANPRISVFLQAVTGIEVLVLVVAGLGLVVQPTVLASIWPWPLTPFNTAFLGAIYTGSMMSAALLVLIGRWSPARVVVPMIALFTGVVLAISLLYLDRFDFGMPSTWVWFLFYVVIPINAGRYLWLYKTLSPAGDQPLGGVLRIVVMIELAAFGLYGLALLAVPEEATAFWPWPVDAFHARLYSVVFLAPALGLWLIVRRAAWAEVLAVGLTLVVGGVLAILTLAATDYAVARVDWTAAGTWVWLAIFVIGTAIGIALLAALSGLPRPAGPLNEAALIVPPRAIALFIGVAFAFAGIVGFVPLFTPPVSHHPEGLEVTAAYGHLLGLFPVNAVHTLFHLAIGILGFAAFLQPHWSLPFIRAFTVVLAGLTVMGLLPGTDITFGLAPLFGHAVWLHGLEAVAAGYVGFVMPTGEARTAAVLQA